MNSPFCIRLYAIATISASVSTLIFKYAKSKLFKKLIFFFLLILIDVVAEECAFYVASITDRMGKITSKRLPNKNMISTDKPNKISFEMEISGES